MLMRIFFKISATNQRLQNHLKSHERKQRLSEALQEATHKCGTCGKTFAHPYHLRVHIAIHDPSIRSLQCKEPGCKETFNVLAEFRQHRKQHSVGTQKKYRICKYCKEPKQTSEEVYTHIREVHADKLFPCKHPGCTFTGITPSRLRRHAESHKESKERLRPYKCTLCEASYIRGHNLEQHMDTEHGGASSATRNPTASSFPCDICSKEFEFDWKLQSHRTKTHGGRKRKSRSSQHIPGSRKPLFYTCEDCDWSFADAGALRYHKKMKHKGDPIPCYKELCDKKYFYVNNLENHIKSQHDDFTEEDELKLEELRRTHPAEAEPEEVKEKTPKPKTSRKKASTQKKKKRSVVEETDDEEESPVAGEEFEEVITVGENGKRQMPPRNSRKGIKRKAYVESDDGEEEEIDTN